MMQTLEAATWVRICRVDDIPALGARVLKRAGHCDIAVFRTAADHVYAVEDRCPHRGGPLSQGIVSGEMVTCPLHNWNIALDTGNALAPDVGCVHRFPVRVQDAEVWLSLELDGAASGAGRG